MDNEDDLTPWPAFIVVGCISMALVLIAGALMGWWGN